MLYFYYMQLFILILHVIGASILLGTSITAVYIVFVKTLTKDMMKFITMVRSLVPAAAIAQLVTGMLLFMGERKEFEGIWQFTLKLILYLISGILGSVILKRKSRTFREGNESHTKALKWLMALDVALLLLISGIGIWIVEK